MRKTVKAVIAASIAVLFCGGASACGELFEGLKDVKVTATEWNKAFAFDYTHYQIDASFVPENEEQETQKVKLEKDGDIMSLQLTEESEDGNYDYSVYAARVANDYIKYEKDETGVWCATKQTKENYNELHASTIMKNLFKEISYSNFIYNETEYAYSYTQALPSGENAATYTVEFLDNRLVEMNIEINIAPITFTFMGMDVELAAGTLSCTFAYEDKDVILPSVTSSNNSASQVTAEEWCAALDLYGAENVQIEVMQNNVKLGHFVKDGDIIYNTSVENALGEKEESYLQINEDGEILKEYYKDETGAWVLHDYQNSDHNAPGSGLGLFFKFGGASTDTYALFTYDEEEGVYSFTTNGPLLGPSESSSVVDNESDITTTITVRFLNKKLVEIVINTGTETEMGEIVLKYTYLVQDVTLPTVSSDEENDRLTETEWEEALDLTAFENVQVHTTSSDGLPVEIKKDGDVVYISVFGEDGLQEAYFEKDGDVYKQYYKNLETGAWMVEECSADQYESLVPINLNNSFSYAEFTYDKHNDVYSRTETVGESQQTIILKFLDKKLVVIEDGTGADLMSIDYEDVELTLPTVDENTNTVSE